MNQLPLKTGSIQVKMEPEEKEKVRRLSIKDKVSMSEWVRVAIRKMIARDD